MPKIDPLAAARASLLAAAESSGYRGRLAPTLGEQFERLASPEVPVDRRSDTQSVGRSPDIPLGARGTDGDLSSPSRERFSDYDSAFEFAPAPTDRAKALAEQVAQFIGEVSSLTSPECAVLLAASVFQGAWRGNS